MLLSGQNIAGVESIFMNCRQRLGSIHVPKELTVVSGQLNHVRDLKLGNQVYKDLKKDDIRYGWFAKNPSWDLVARGHNSICRQELIIVSQRPVGNFAHENSKR
jgi:hypothetical protein